jgi:hypothetical protein
MNNLGGNLSSVADEDNYKENSDSLCEDLVKRRKVFFPIRHKIFFCLQIGQASTPFAKLN